MGKCECIERIRSALDRLTYVRIDMHPDIPVGVRNLRKPRVVIQQDMKTSSALRLVCEGAEAICMPERNQARRLSCWWGRALGEA